MLFLCVRKEKALPEAKGLVCRDIGIVHLSSGAQGESYAGRLGPFADHDTVICRKKRKGRSFLAL
jgi:hypothetical protein